MGRDDFAYAVGYVDEVHIVLRLCDRALPLLVVRVAVAGAEALRRVAVIAPLEIQFELVAS